MGDAFFPTRPIRHRIAAAVLVGAAASPCGAQLTRTNEVTANVASVGVVLAVSPLQSGPREPSGDLQVSGTVTVRQNGSFQLQVRLTTPFTTRDGANTVVNEVLVRVPGGAWEPLGTGTWVTVATGPGTASTVTSVRYLIRWGPTSPKNPRPALSLPLEYQVVPP
jgi:hypothetical protein